MPLIARWALQGVALFVFGWMAVMAGHWSSEVVDGTSSDRLSMLGEGALVSSKTVASNEAAGADQ
jgi:hypothetical protein